LKGLSKELDADTSDKLRRCCIDTAVAVRRAVEVNGVRAHWHTRLDAFDVSAGMVVQ
jgi:adenylosuccinate synthase